MLTIFLAAASLATAVATALSPQSAPSPTPSPTPARLSIHAQMTNTQQYHGAFPASYGGQQSLASTPDAAKTFSGTLFLGMRVWKGGAFFITPEVDQGFGLGNSPGPGLPYNGTVGIAGYVSGEAYKVGSGKWYGRVHRYFVRQTFDHGKPTQDVDDDQEQVAGAVAPRHAILTVGKFSVVDVFDNNPYAHDPRNDFLNWSIIDLGAFDYAADAWGFTYGLSAEFVRPASALRLGIFQLSRAPNVTVIEKTPFLQYSPVFEYERDTSLFGGRPGSVKLLAYGDYGYMAPLADATAYALAHGTAPDPTRFRTHRHWKLGGGINVAQEVAPHVGAFLRVSAMNGSYEAFDFTEIDRSISGGISLEGAIWHRPLDSIGVAAVANAISAPEAAYLSAGGMGVLAGDGALSYGGERVLEAYYKLGLMRGFSIKGDVQRIRNPAYNTKRGPVTIYGIQIHEEL